MGGGNQLDALRELARGLDLSADDLHFTGRIPDEEVRRTLSSADVAISPDPANDFNEYCTMNKTLEYMETLFANQPSENTSGLTDEQLAEYAKQVGAEDAASCITDGTYAKWGVAQAKQHEIAGTPTVEVNGKRLDLQKGELQQMLDVIS